VTSRHGQKYRSEWKKLPQLKGWIQPCSTDINKAFCKYCKCLLNAKLGDLQKHVKTKKHETYKPV
jgi:hypothetical protein